MKSYEIALLPQDANYYHYDTDEFFPLDFTEICEVSQDEDMIPLSPAGIKGHTIGMVTVARWWTPHDVQHTEVATYAGITGFKLHDNKKLAVVGAALTMPWARGQGHGLATVQALEEAAASGVAIHRHGHQGLLARCDQVGQSFTKKLGFSEAGADLGKTLMVKMF